MWNILTDTGSAVYKAIVPIDLVHCEMCTIQYNVYTHTHYIVEKIDFGCEIVRAPLWKVFISDSALHLFVGKWKMTWI